MSTYRWGGDEFEVGARATTPLLIGPTLAVYMFSLSGGRGSD